MIGGLGVVTLGVCHVLEAVILTAAPRPQVGRVDYLNVLMTELVAQGLFRLCILGGGVLLGASLARRPELGLWHTVGLDQLMGCRVWRWSFWTFLCTGSTAGCTFRGLWGVHTVHHSPRRLAAIASATTWSRP